MPEYEAGDREDEAFQKYNGDNWQMVVPFDARFPHQNQTDRCFTYFTDFHRCKNIKGDWPHCYWYKKAYQSACATILVRRWNEQIEKGTFPYKLDK